MANTATIAADRGDMEHSGNCQGTWMLDVMSGTIDHTGPGNDYEAPFPITTTAFAEDICVVQDEEPVYANIQ